MSKFMMMGMMVVALVIAYNNYEKNSRNKAFPNNHQRNATRVIAQRENNFSNKINKSNASYWQEKYDEAKHYYNEYKNSSLLWNLYNKHAEFLVQMSIYSWNLGNDSLAIEHLNDAIDLLNNYYGTKSSQAANVLLTKMENGTCPREIPVDIVIGTTWDPIAKVQSCVNYGVVTTIMRQADKAQFNREMEFLGRMQTLGFIAQGQINSMKIQAQMDASQIRCSARLHYQDKTHEIFDPMHRPQQEGIKQQMWDRTKAIYNIYND